VICKPNCKAISLVSAILIAILTTPLLALDYPGKAPANAASSATTKNAILENSVIRAQWNFKDGRVKSLAIKNKHTSRTVKINNAILPSVVLENGNSINFESAQIKKALHLNHNAVMAIQKDEASGLNIVWTASLQQNDNAIIQSIKIIASKDTQIKELVFFDTKINWAKQIGEVSGSVIVAGNIFMAIEHPLAQNTVDKKSQVRCSLPRGNTLKAGQSWDYSSVIGVTPKGQLRRGFLYYLERRRAHPYRQYLHYNNWYDVLLRRKKERIRENECLEAIEIYRRELVEKRNTKLEAFVWDDGWDNFRQSLWGFHGKFKDGFRNLNKVSRKFGAAQGVWMSPWGGYGPAKDKRIAYGKSQGYETNKGGFSMAGPKYQKAFRDVCIDMIRNNGVEFFKFDGMGGGNESKGATNNDDVDAVLELTNILRKEKPDVFISATIGTWASPFWLLYSDSIWRQGHDNALYGKGNTRQQWLTYRDKLCYERIVQKGPLYPLNSLMLHGVLIGKRKSRSPGRLAFDEKSVRDEAWTFFGSGTGTQELYVNPKDPTPHMWDSIANAANWARKNADVLIDSHWIGGDPGKEQVYGWASWKPGKGIIVLRNPSDKTQNFSITPKQAFELPKSVKGKMQRSYIYPNIELKAGPIPVNWKIKQTLEPFQTVVMELHQR